VRSVPTVDILRGLIDVGSPRRGTVVPEHSAARPDDLSADDERTVEAVGRFSEGFERLIRARGALYEFHQQMGRCDALFGEAVELLENAGHHDVARDLDTTLVGRNAIPDRWTFEIVEAFDDTYYEVAAAFERRVRDALSDGRRHDHEARMKADRRTSGPDDDRS
jgi:hypothetical protein